MGYKIAFILFVIGVLILVIGSNYPKNQVFPTVAVCVIIIATASALFELFFGDDHH